MTNRNDYDISETELHQLFQRGKNVRAERRLCNYTYDHSPARALARQRKHEREDHEARLAAGLLSGKGQ